MTEQLYRSTDTARQRPLVRRNVQQLVSRLKHTFSRLFVTIGKALLDLKTKDTNPITS